MESVAVSATTGVLNILLGKLTEMLGVKYKLVKRVRDDIEFLELELRTMKIVLDGTAGSKLNPLHKMWRDTLLDMSYDMEDLIDISLQHISPTDDVTNSGLVAKMTRKLKKLTMSHKIAPLIQELKAHVEREREWKNMYNLDLSSDRPSDPPMCAVSGEKEMLIGIDDSTNQVISWLMPKTDMDLPQQVTILSIVGCGGLGKTTLTNEVYLKIKDIFQCAAFVTVSQKPSIKDILLNICSQVKATAPERSNKDDLIRSLNEYLQDKRYCVVLDDIWESDTWKSIGAALVKSGPGSIIIITSRNKDVAESCHGGRVHEMDHLSDSDSKQLFFTRIFGSEENCPPELVQASKEILSKCEGIPLAITSISAVLAKLPKSINNWNKVKECISSRVPGSKYFETMQSILELSYFNLPHELKGCLLYFSAFPEDSKIEKDHLVRRWVGEGLISARQGETTHEVGVKYFNMLVNMSLIKPCYEDNGEAMTCRVHDIILDFIVLKSAEENFVTLLKSSGLSHSPPTTGKVRRLLVQGGYTDGAVVPWKDIKLPHVRSVASSNMDCNNLPPLSKFKVLRVLDLEGCESLENKHLESIHKLVLLRYLSIRQTSVSELPAGIGEARHLETLDIRNTKVIELPSSIVLLQRLVSLLAGTEVKFPAKGISKMKALEELGRVSITLQSLSFLKELGELTKLRVLDLLCECSLSDNTDECLKILATSLGVLGTHNLCSLIFEVRDVSDAFMVSLSLFPALKTLQKLKIWDISIVPNWLGSLVNLESLGLGAIEITQDGLRVLGCMSALEALSLYNCHSKDRIIMNNSDGFRHLKFLSMEVPNMLFMPGSAPNLEDLRMDLNLGMDGCDDSGIQHLPSLTKVLICIKGPDCSSVERKATELTSIVDAHPNRPILRIEADGYRGL